MSDIVKQDEVFGNYYNRINSLILKTKQNVVKNINYEMVELYYAIGSTINELIEEYHLEASQNKILKSFSEKLTREFGEGYSVPNLKLMKKFYLTYKDGYTLCNQLSWSHNRLIMNIDNEVKRNFYLEETIKSNRFKSDDWVAGERINGGVVSEYHQWDSVEVLSSDPVLRSRRIGREDGAEKMEYTAENPANLLDTLTGRVTFDLEWVNEHYDYVPDANWSFVVSDAKGDYVSENFDALYAKKNGSGYVDFTIDNIAQADYFDQTYVIDGSYETAYYYTSVDGHEFLIEMDNGHVWVQCRTSHANVSLHGAYLTTDEVEDILDNLSLAINE